MIKLPTIHPDDVEQARLWLVLVCGVLAVYKAQRDLFGWYRMKAYSA